MKCFIYNLTEEKLIKQKIKFAKTFFKRLKGLMFKKNVDFGLVLKINNKEKINSSIHTYFMKFPIDVYFINKNKEIYEIATLKPWKSYTPKKPARFIIEFKKNTLKNKELKINDKIDFVCENN